MTVVDRHRLLADGTARNAREPEAFRPGYFAPEERRLEHFLMLLAGTAEQTPFYDARGNDQPGGWRAVFGSDPIFAYAELLTTRIDERRAAFNSLLEDDPVAALEELATAASSLVRLRRALDVATEGSVAALFDALGGQGARTDVAVWLDRLANAQAEGRAAAVLEIEGVETGEDPVEAAFAIRRAVRQTHDRMLNVTASLQAPAREAFDARLASGEVNPALGLAVAKLDALCDVAERMNGFTERHTEFYYRDVLGQTPKPGAPDRVFLILTPGARPLSAPRDAALTAQTEAGESRVYRLLDDVRASPIQVAETRILRHRRDLDMRPQGGMGFVTSVTTLTVPTVAAPDAETQRLYDATGGVDVEMGVRVGSPALWLSEGRRRITVEINFTRRGSVRGGGPLDNAAVAAETPTENRDGPDDEVAQALFADARLMALFELEPSRATTLEMRRWVGEARGLAPAAPPIAHLLHALLLMAPSAPPDAVRAVYGRAVSAALIEGMPWPEGAFRAALLGALGKNAPDSEVVKNATRLFDTDRPSRFQELLGESFLLRITTAEGWRLLPNARVSETASRGRPGLRFTVVLDGAAPPIAPLAEQETPEIAILLAPNARFSAVSMLEPYILESIDIAVQVQGLTRLAAFTETGPLDIAQPVLPFGVQPRNGAAFAIGCPEIARKAVERIGVSVVWDDLPATGDGLGEIYEGYGDDFEPPEPRLGVAYLTGDGWKPLTETPIPMFMRNPATRAFEADGRLEARVPGDAEPPAYGVDPAAFKRRRDIHAGLLRLVLVGEEDAFGHAAYPLALARALRPSYLPFRRRVVPRPPYTPRIASISLDYAARTRIVLAAPGHEARRERVIQIGPFGEVEIAPSPTRASAGLAPERIADGALFARLDGADLTGKISLLFRMSEGSHRRRVFTPAPIVVKYLTALGWSTLPAERIVSDTTERLMRTGIVTLNLPIDAVRESSEMPGRGVWLAFCSDGRLDDYPRLLALQTNAACAERDPGGAGTADLDGQAATLRSVAFDPPLGGVAAVVPIGRTFAGAAAETDRGFRTRMAERLRHRGRAVTPWDIERLTLAAFPEVWKAKCFPAYRGVNANDGPAGAETPGAVVVVVVPHPPAERFDSPDVARTFDVLTLRRIETALADVASPFAKITVRNPSFERLQIRGRLTFDSASDGGALAQRLKQDVSRHLSVWCAAPPLDGFGWSFHLGDVGGFVLSRPYVRSLTSFSVLQLVRRDGGAHRLVDTAREGGTSILLPVEPWSLPLPMSEHWIQAEPAESAAAAPDPKPKPKPAGIGGLRVGGNLVVVEKAGT